MRPFSFAFETEGQPHARGKRVGASMRQPTGLNGCEVAVIGAGPYGLAVAAHLKHAGVETQVFGEAVSFWSRHMPRGMKLRSPWGATHIADPTGTLSLDVYDATGRMPRNQPVPLRDFVAYGRWFQEKAVPELDTRRVVRVDKAGERFRLTLDDGASLVARRVVVALGLANQEYRPAEFDGLPGELVSHASEHDDLGIFAGKRIAVVGRGQSATESAALLGEAGADVTLIARGPIHWLGEGGQPAPFKRMLAKVLTPPSAVGPFPLNWLAELPGLTRRMPDDMRAAFSARSLKPGAAGWLRPRFGPVTVEADRTIIAARPDAQGVALILDNGPAVFDHVLLATGYRPDVSRLGILSADIMARLDRIGGAPRLAAGLESSVPGLHFVGSAAVASFGPLMRFIAGSGYAARALTRRVAVAHGARQTARPFTPDLDPLTDADVSR